MDYDFEINRIIEEIKKLKAKRVLLQLPEGLKPKATEIADQLKKKTDAEILIWTGSNLGGCDLAQAKGVDLLVHFGHAKFKE